MSGLVAYDSSDEDNGFQEDVAPRTRAEVAEQATEEQKPTRASAEDSKSNGNSPPHSRPKDAPLVTSATMIGPSLGPSNVVNSSIPSPLPDESDVSAPSSPYSAGRALLRQLTLPTVPNYDIPPSPPGSPSESTNKKFGHFLELKKQGVHFNEKLAKSSALKNPSLMQKLMDFADVDEVSQYANTLSKDLWEPKAFPDWAYKEELAKSQKQMLKREEEKARGSRESIDFVPATASGNSSRSGTPGISTGLRAGPKSAVERVMAGLERSTSPHVQAGMKRKTRFDS